LPQAGHTDDQKIISVSQAAAEFHLAHGDYVVTAEACDGLDDDCNGEVDEGCDVCSPEGAVRCNGTGFDTCASGLWVYRDCSPGTECRPLDSSILCDFPTQ
jgi:hypothetical protein